MSGPTRVLHPLAYQSDEMPFAPKVNSCSFLERPLLLFGRTPPGRTREISYTSSKEKRQMKKNQEGFSLIELLTVVASILTIAAIAIPNLLRARMAANEASAVGSLRTINTACVAYSTSYGTFPTALSNLGPIAANGTASSTSADLIDSVLSAGQKSGYNFAYAPAKSN